MTGSTGFLIIDVTRARVTSITGKPVRPVTAVDAAPARCSATEETASQKTELRYGGFTPNEPVGCH